MATILNSSAGSARALLFPLCTIAKIRPLTSKSAPALTNGTNAISKEATILTILECYDLLASFGEDIHPGSEVDTLFRKLVRACTTLNHYEDEILIEPRIVSILPHLREICSRGEFLLESAYAERIINAEFPTLKSFPYYENYDSLVRLELAALSYLKPTSLSPVRGQSCLPTKFAFIGCGPLPLTAFSIAAQLSSVTTVSHVNGAANAGALATFLNVDRNLDALRMAEVVARRLGFGAQEMVFLAADVGAAEGGGNTALNGARGRPLVLAEELSTVDVLVVAALVGATAVEKRAVIRECVREMRVGARIVVRTARGLRGVLYPVVGPAELHIEDVEWVNVMHPLDEVVNSVIVGHIVGRAG